MSRSPIQVPDELKARIEGLKETLYINTIHGVIEKLVKFYEETQENKIRQAEERAAAKAKFEAEAVNLGSELKNRYVSLQNELGFRDEGAALIFLLEHYKNSPTLDKETFKVFRGLR